MCQVSYDTIRYYMLKFNIPIRSKSEANHLRQVNHCNLSQKAIEWINGELLGDGCLQLSSKYSAKFKYGSKYFEYIKYVRNTLELFGIKKTGKIYKVYHKDMDCHSYHYSSRAYPELLAIHKRWYPNGRKIIPKNLKVTPLTLRQHYIGDGYLSHHKLGRPSIGLCTCGFTVADVECFLEKLTKLGIRAKRNAKNLIRISAYSVNDFLNYIGKCPVKCYTYKWNI